MISVAIPGREPLEIRHLVLDFNGTIALDGTLLPGARERLAALSELVDVAVLTADTHGSAAAECQGTGARLEVFDRGAAGPQKAAIVHALGACHTVAIGNGANDCAMCQMAVLGIAIVGTEGAAAQLLSNCDMVVTSLDDALDLLLKPERLIATLRW